MYCLFPSNFGADITVDVQAIGAAAANQSIKAIALAQSFLEPEGTYITSVPPMVDIDDIDRRMTAIRIAVSCTDMLM